MKILLHACCGPCSVFPVLKLKGLKINFDIYFYNPNIHSIEELNKRYLNLTKVCNMYKVKLFKNLEIDTNYFIKHKDDSNRCSLCYIKRFDEVFKFAKENNYDYVLTTLLGSPFQSRDLLLSNLKDSSNKYDVKFLDINFKEGFYMGQKIARENKIYCQKFCGCFVSYENYIKNKESIDL